MTQPSECLRGDYFVFLKPIDDESKKILSDKEYKNKKSIAQMWRESID